MISWGDLAHLKGPQSENMFSCCIFDGGGGWNPIRSLCYPLQRAALSSETPSIHGREHGALASAALLLTRATFDTKIRIQG